jgi:RecB family exonuclease
MGENVYSISRLDCINECLYQAYQTYRLDDRGDKNIWSILGGEIHRILEDIVNDKATEADLLPAMKEELHNIELFGLDFPKDSRGGTAIRDSWIANMDHFCNTYKSPKGKNLQTEVEVHYTSPKGHKLIGYIDLLKTNKDGSVEIYDYKTSAMYKGDDLLKHGRQLVTYSLAIKQHGYNVRSVSWIMLKYVDVTYIGYKTVKSKEKTELKKTIERRKIVKELESSIRKELEEQNCSNVEIDFLLEDALKTNTIPQQVAHLYKIRPCVITYDITEEIEKECIDYIDNTIDLWEQLNDDECKSSHRPFTKIQKNGKEVPDIFPCISICPHFKRCPHIQDYLAQQEIKEDDYEDLF